MTNFPAAALTAKVEILVNGVWTDITAYVYTRDGIQISSRGKPDEASRPNPAAANLTLQNDGRFTPRNPAGPYYPYIGRNTQLRVSAPTDPTQAALQYRFWGEVVAWPTTWDPTGTDVYVPVQAAGVLRRLSQNRAPLRSSLYRGMLAKTGSLVPVAYWPMEDGAGAVSFSSPLAGVRPLQWSATGNNPTLAAFGGFPCSGPLPAISGARLDGQIPSGPPPAAAVWRHLLEVPSSTPPADGRVITRAHFTGGTVEHWTLDYRTSGGLELQFYDALGALMTTTGNMAWSMLDGLWQVSVEIYDGGIGARTAYTLSAFNVATGALNTTTGTLSAAVAFLHTPTRIVVNPDNQLFQTVVGHLSLQSAQEALNVSPGPATAWAGETAGNRLSRLCGEEGVNFASGGDLGNTVAMGAQLPAQLTSLLFDCADADGGILGERYTTLGLRYVCLNALVNQAPAATLDYSAKQLAQPPPVPVDDDQLTRNDVTVSRPGGSSARAYLASGALSVQAPPAGAGPYEDAPEVNAAYDSQLDDLAGWRLHLGTVDEPRYPAVTVDMARSQVAGNTALFAAVAALDQFGPHLQITNPPAGRLPPGTVKQLVIGLRELIVPPGIWQITFTGAPESPYEVAVADAAPQWHVDTDGSTLHANITTAAASMSVDTAAGNAIWTTAAADFPFDIAMGGEQITVTNITGAAPPQTFTVTRSVNGVVKAHTAGDDIRLFNPPIVALT